MKVTFALCFTLAVLIALAYSQNSCYVAPFCDGEGYPGAPGYQFYCCPFGTGFPSPVENNPFECTCF
ncbi:hypothetical protein RRG08_055476 [Elysia crispata]|uniref:Uncharacterized protein n=1 Tax=Elysia crispata TaxID=231223 RepID=A0AAE0Y0S8_9GAST|nr:hypothetical protein RRG08_055476 [Elysia crispata]